jgi:hypothetical protein
MRTYLKYPKHEKQRKPKQRTRDWCPGGGKVLEVFCISRDDDWKEERLRKVEYIRCPVCDKKMEICNDDDPGPFSWEMCRKIPKHKSY